MHEPVTLLAVDSLVSKMIALVPLAARADFEERKAQLSADLHQDRKHCSELTAKISKVDKNKFLFIGQEWTGQQRNDFREGTNYYKSKARAVYCQSAGLHRSFIETAQVSELVTALKNLALVSPSAPTSSLPANKVSGVLVRVLVACVGALAPYPLRQRQRHGLIAINGLRHGLRHAFIARPLYLDAMPYAYLRVTLFCHLFVLLINCLTRSRLSCCYRSLTFPQL
jgi:hypothetical protein